IVGAAEGWALVPREKAFDVIPAWGLSRYRDRLLYDGESMMRTRMERLPPFDVGFSLLVDRDSKQVGSDDPRTNPRLILPVRTGRSFITTIEKLPDFRLFPEVHFEVVSAEEELTKRALNYL